MVLIIKNRLKKGDIITITPVRSYKDYDQLSN